MRHALVGVSLCCALLVAGCGLLPSPSALEEHRASPIHLTEKQRWWSPLHDPLMDVLADELVAENLEMQMALARIDEARGIRRGAGSGLFPQIALGGEHQRGNRQNPTTETVAQGGFDASWEIDLFGRVRSGMEAAEAEEEAATAASDDMRNSIVAELVRAVIEWREAQEMIRVTQSLIASQDDQIGIVKSRTKAGLAEGSALERALAQREQTATQLPLAKAAATTAQHQIERLLAKEPGKLSKLLAFYHDEKSRLPTASDALELDIKAIRERPDVRAARATLAARSGDLAQAESELWPRLSLRGFYGAADASAGALIGVNPLWSIAANASMPLLNFGRLRGAVDAADARSKRAALHYQNTALAALQDTHTALSDYLHGIEAVVKLEQSLEHRETAVKLARERFSNGLTDMTDLTTAQTELDETTLTLIQRKAATSLAFVRLHKALGTATVTPLDPAKEEPGEDALGPIDPNDPNAKTMR